VLCALCFELCSFGGQKYKNFARNQKNVLCINCDRRWKKEREKGRKGEGETGRFQNSATPFNFV
jgi:hypothetical protein